MKTIRTNCFETNSSSTHSFTIHKADGVATLKPIQTFIPDENGLINVSLGSVDGDYSSMMNKLQFLLYYTFISGDNEKFQNVIKVVESFTKAKLKILKYSYDYKTKVGTNTEITNAESTNKDLDEIIEDEFCQWIGDYGNESVEDFKECADSWLENDQSILVFIFSGVSPFSSETYYNG